MSAICVSKRFLSARISLLVEVLCVTFSEKVGGSISGWDGMCLKFPMSVWAWGCIGVLWVIRLVGFVVGAVVEVGVGDGRGGRGGSLGGLCFRVLLPLTTWDYWRLMVGARNHAPYCWSSVLLVALPSVQRWQSFSSWLRTPHQYQLYIYISISTYSALILVILFDKVILCPPLIISLIILQTFLE